MEALNSGRSLEGRFPVEDHKGHSNKSILRCNYVRGIECFDNRFFKKSSCEAASTDPQQRFLLEVVYQALELSGYFDFRERDVDVGCIVAADIALYSDKQNLSLLKTLMAIISSTFDLDDQLRIVFTDVMKCGGPSASMASSAGSIVAGSLTVLLVTPSAILLP
jgi:acyl transferase domain-containing protein